MADLSATSKLADPTLLEAIDKLFELNIGEYVALPQVKHSITNNPSRTDSYTAPGCGRPVQVSMPILWSPVLH